MLACAVGMLSPCFPKLQIFMTRASCRRQHLTLSLAVWFLFFLTMDVWRGKVLDCLLLQDILKGNECTNITGKKKRALCKVVQRWRENSNNISLKKSTSDTLLLRTYKQTELLCAHINNRNTGLLGCRLLRAMSS